MIYFVHLESGSIKIGFTDNLQQRLSLLASHYRSPVVLLATMAGDRAVEDSVHERFDHLRLGRTEQFRPAADLMEFIGKPQLVSPDPDVVEATPEPMKSVRISLDAYDMLSRLAGMKRMKLGDCASDLILRYADRETKEHAKAILKRGEPKG